MRQGLGEMCPTNLLIVSISRGTDVCLKLVCVKFYGLERAAALDKLHDLKKFVQNSCPLTGLAPA